MCYGLILTNAIRADTEQLHSTAVSRQLLQVSMCMCVPRKLPKLAFVCDLGQSGFLRRELFVEVEEIEGGSGQLLELRREHLEEEKQHGIICRFIQT